VSYDHPQYWIRKKILLDRANFSSDQKKYILNEYSEIRKLYPRSWANKSMKQYLKIWTCCKNISEFRYILNHFFQNSYYAGNKLIRKAVQLVSESYSDLIDPTQHKDFFNQLEDKISYHKIIIKFLDAIFPKIDKKIRHKILAIIIQDIASFSGDKIWQKTYNFLRKYVTEIPKEILAEQVDKLCKIVLHTSFSHKQKEALFNLAKIPGY
jgi:hypothetical protein